MISLFSSFEGVHYLCYDANGVVSFAEAMLSVGQSSRVFNTALGFVLNNLSFVISTSS